LSSIYRTILPLQHENRAGTESVNPSASAGDLASVSGLRSVLGLRSSVLGLSVKSAPMGSDSQLPADARNPRPTTQDSRPVIQTHFAPTAPEFVPSSGIFPRAPTHLTSLGSWLWGVLRLTCLSVRCLSSYLIFPPAPVTSKPRPGSPGEVRRRKAGTDSCAVSNSPDLNDAIWKKTIVRKSGLWEQACVKTIKNDSDQERF
jgi:hypothetical protein